MPKPIMKKIKEILIKRLNNSRMAVSKHQESGFSLVEAMIAMTILLIALLGVFATFTYAVNYNAGNNARTQALALLQQRVELLRSLKFTPTLTDGKLAGGTIEEVASVNGNKFRIKTIVDDDPFTNGVQTDSAKTLKEITITVSLDSPTPGWQSAVPATIILRRVRAN